MRKTSLLVLAGLALIVIPVCKKAPTMKYPPTAKAEQVDDYFGTQVADPYRWLEDDTSAETAAWVKAQNEVTSGYLAKIPFREALKKRLTDIFNYPRFSSPFRVGDRYFFSKNDGLQNQSVIYVQKGLDGAPEVFIDPNALSADGTVRTGLLGPSGDKKLMAVSRGEAGSDWSEIRVMDIAAKQELSDVIKWVKFSGAAWWKDGFFYSGYDKPEAGKELTAKNEFQKVFYHKLGDPQEKDVVVFEDKDHPLRYVGAGVTEDEMYAFVTLSEGTSGTELYWRDLTKPGSAFALLMKGFDHDSAVIDNVGDKFLVQTNLEAPNGKIILIDPKRPDKTGWTVVVPEKPEALRGRGHGRRSAVLHLPQGRQHQDFPVRPGREAGAGDRAPGPRHFRRAERLARRHDPLLRLHLVHLSADHLQVRHRHRRVRGLPQARGQVRPPGLRDQAGLLRQQGRDQGADVHRPQEGPGPGRDESLLPDRLRWVQHQQPAVLQPAAHRPARAGSGLRRAQPARRRRVRRDLA